MIRSLDRSACLVALVVAFAALASAQTPPKPPEIVIENVTVISPERAAPLPHATVIIRNGRIAQVGTKLSAATNAQRIDGSGEFLIPGLIDSHVHVGHSAALDDDSIDAHPELWAAYRAQVPRAYLAFGFTSVVDLDLTPATKAWFDSTPLHPRLYSCGRGITVAGGYTAFQVPPAGSPNFPNLVYDPQEAKSWPGTLNAADYSAERAVTRAADSGAICVKAFVESGFGMFNWPYLHTETLRQIQKAAAARNLLLMVHATSIDAWRSTIDAHADVIAHGLWTWPGDPNNSTPPPAARAVIADAARARIHVQPTLQTVGGERSIISAVLLDDPRLEYALPASVIGYLRSTDGQKARTALLESYRKASPPPGFDALLPAAIERTQATFKMMLQIRVPLLFGSDTPAGEGFGNPPGLNGILELRSWAEQGAPLSLIFRAATLDNATALGLSNDLGTIEPGRRADLLLLRENPLVRISAYDSIETIFLNGVPIARESLLP